jgi:glutathione S-transferase
MGMIHCPCATGSIAATTYSDPSYVILVALGMIPVLSFSQGNVVVGYRKKAQVPCTIPALSHHEPSNSLVIDPNFYAGQEQCEKSPEAYTFNCAQRAHGQLLENMPQTMLMMMVGGLTYPRLTAVMGLGWVFGRILYAYGYITSKKAGKGRAMGSMFWLFQGGIWGTCVATALKMLA